MGYKHIAKFLLTTGTWKETEHASSYLIPAMLTDSFNPYNM